MSEPTSRTDVIPSSEPTVETARPVEPVDTVENRRPSRLGQVAAWVGIVAGIVFIVAVVFFSGFILGAHSGGGHHRGGHGPGGEGGRHGGSSQMGPDFRGGGPGFRMPGGPGGFGGPGGPGGPRFESPTPPDASQSPQSPQTPRAPQPSASVTPAAPPR